MAIQESKVTKMATSSLIQLHQLVHWRTPDTHHLIREGLDCLVIEAPIKPCRTPCHYICPLPASIGTRETIQ